MATVSSIVSPVSSPPSAIAWIEPSMEAIGSTDSPMASKPRKMNLEIASLVFTGSSATSVRTFMAFVMASSDGGLECASMTDTSE